MSDIYEFEIDPDELHLVGKPAAGISPLMAKSQKESKKVKRSSKDLEELQRAVNDLSKAIAASGGLAGTESGRQAGAEHSRATVSAAFDRTLGRLGNPFQPFEDRVGAAQQAVAKARQNGDEYSLAAAKSDLRQARHQLTLIKMIASEHARQHDPAMMARRLNGQGTPLFSNKHQLGDDPTVRYQ